MYKEMDTRTIKVFKNKRTFNVPYKSFVLSVSVSTVIPDERFVGPRPPSDDEKNRAKILASSKNAQNRIEETEYMEKLYASSLAAGLRSEAAKHAAEQQRAQETQQRQTNQQKEFAKLLATTSAAIKENSSLKLDLEALNFKAYRENYQVRFSLVK